MSSRDWDGRRPIRNGLALATLKVWAGCGLTAVDTNQFLGLYCKGVVRAFGRTPQQNAPTTNRSFCQPTQKEAPTVHPPDGLLESKTRFRPCRPLID